MNKDRRSASAFLLALNKHSSWANAWVSQASSLLFRERSSSVAFAFSVKSKHLCALGKRTMTDRSPEVIWALTKRFNCNKTRWMGKDWTTSPFSVDGRHNASQAANTIGISVRKDSAKTNFRRTFTLNLKHKAKNGIAKRKTGSQGNPATSTIDIREPTKAAKAIQSCLFLSDQDKNAALRKLGRAAASTRSAVKGSK